MKLLNIPQSVELDDTFSKNTANHSVDTNNAEQENIETKRPSIFDDDFQGIEWPVKKQHEYVYGIDRDSIFDPIYGMHILNGGAIFYHDDDD